MQIFNFFLFFLKYCKFSVFNYIIQCCWENNAILYKNILKSFINKSRSCKIMFVELLGRKADDIHNFVQTFASGDVESMKGCMQVMLTFVIVCCWQSAQICLARVQVTYILLDIPFNNCFYFLLSIIIRVCHIMNGKLLIYKSRTRIYIYKLTKGALSPA